MISTEKIGGHNNLAHAEFRGLTQDLPQLINMTGVPNGSTFYSIDESKTFMYDAEQDKWILQSTGGGGSYDGLPIYLWVGGQSFKLNDLVIKDSQLYICKVANSDVTWDSSHWSIIGSSDSNYGIVNLYSDLPQGLSSTERKIYYVLSAKCYYLWDGTAWGQMDVVETITQAEIDLLFE